MLFSLNVSSLTWLTCTCLWCYSPWMSLLSPGWLVPVSDVILLECLFFHLADLYLFVMSFSLNVSSLTWLTCTCLWCYSPWMSLLSPGWLVPVCDVILLECLVFHLADLYLFVMLFSLNVSSLTWLTCTCLWCYSPWMSLLSPGWLVPVSDVVLLECLFSHLAESYLFVMLLSLNISSLTWLTCTCLWCYSPWMSLLSPGWVVPVSDVVLLECLFSHLADLYLLVMLFSLNVSSLTWLACTCLWCCSPWISLLSPGWLVPVCDVVLLEYLFSHLADLYLFVMLFSLNISSLT